MDGSSFDRLARLIGSSASRRAALKALAGGVLAAAGVPIGADRAGAAGKRAIGNSCKVNDDCVTGLCVQERRTRKICHCAGPQDCPAPDQCHEAACLPNGRCGGAVKNGAVCDDGDRCTTGDRCLPNGTCAGAPAVCVPLDDCHLAGTCNPATGQCSNPVKPAVDCAVSTWSAWGACSAKCGGGTQTRSRTVVTPASCGGAVCPSLTDSRSCNGFACGACAGAQWSSNDCSNWTFTDGTVVCAGGGDACNGSCSSDADCPWYSPYCLVSYTLALPGHALETCGGTGGCSGFVPCPISAS